MGSCVSWPCFQAEGEEVAGAAVVAIGVYVARAGT